VTILYKEMYSKRNL